MPNPYFQVARTYLQRPARLLHRSLFISGILFFNIYIFFNVGKVLQFYLFLFIVLFSCWSVHVKEQFATPRASLTPGFRKIHAVVATTAATVLVILLPGVTALLINRQPIGLISITTLLFGIILWAILRLGNIFFPIIAAGLVLTLFVPIRENIEKIVSGNEPVQIFIIMSIGIILSITGIIRLFLLNEDNSEYRLSFKSLMHKSRGWRRWFASRTAARMIYHARHAADSCWSRMHRWNFLNRSVLSALFLTIFFKLLSTSVGHFNETVNFQGATIIPLILLIYEFNKKRRFMAQDIMMPVSRDSYLKELGISFAFIQFIAWTLAIAVSIVWIFIVSAKPNPEFFIYSITYSFMMQIWMFGLAIWIYSSRITPLYLILIIITWLSVEYMKALDVQMVVPWKPLILGVLLALLGLLLTWRGYRRWMVKDFDPKQKDENMGAVLFNKRYII